MRRLFPRFEWGGWGGATVDDPSGRDEYAEGRALCIQWCGWLFEIAIGRVDRLRR